MMKKKKIIIVISLVIVSICLYVFLNNHNQNKTNDNEDIPPILADYQGTLYNSNVINFDHTTMVSKNVQTALEELVDSINDGCHVGYEKGTTTASLYTCNKKSEDSDQTLVLLSEYVKYSNSNSGLNATNVRDAIVELSNIIPYCRDGYAKTNETSNSYDCEESKLTNTINLTCDTLTYDGTAKALLSSATAADGIVFISTTSLDSSNYFTDGQTSVSNVTETNAGSYTVYAYVPESNDYLEASDSVECSIAKASNSISLTCASLTYNGSNQNLISSKSATAGSVYIATTSLDSTNYSTAGGTALSSAQGKNAGSYTVYAYTPGNSNYAAKSSSKSCSIAKKATTSSLSGSSGTVAKSSSKNITLTTDGDGEITCSTSSSSIATCSVTNKTIKITGKSTAGSATITVSQAAGTNYKAASNKTYKIYVGTWTDWGYNSSNCSSSCTNHCSVDWSCAPNTPSTGHQTDSSTKCWCLK